MRDAVGNSYVIKINIKQSRPIMLQECDFSVKRKNLFTSSRVFCVKTRCNKYFNLNKQLEMHLFKPTLTFVCHQCNANCFLISFSLHCEGN